MQTNKRGILIITAVLFMGVTASIQAQTVSVEHHTIREFGSQEPVYPTLGIPRWQLVPGADSAVLVSFLNLGRADLPTLFKSVDGGQSWPYQLEFSNWPDNHTHLSSDNDTVYYCAPLSQGGVVVRIIPIDSFQESAFSVVDDNPHISRAAVWVIPGSDTAVMVIRSYGQNGDHLLDITYRLSPDRGRSWGPIDYIVDWRGKDSQNRIGAQIYDNSVAAVIYSALNVPDGEEPDSILWYNFDRSGGSWQREIFPALTGRMTRGYSHNTLFDTVQFVMTEVGSDTIRYAYKNRGSSLWTSGILGVFNDYGSPNFYHTALSYIESSRRLVCFYRRWDGSSSEDAFRIYMKYWEPGSSSWSEEYLISDGVRNEHFSGCFRVPYSHGDQTYVQYSANIGGNYYIRLAVVKFESEAQQEIGPPQNLRWVD